VAPLTQAILKRDPARLQQLLDAGEDPNKHDVQGYTSWMWAIHFQENDALQLLLKNIKSIDHRDARMLATAASLNNLVAVRTLLSKGVPVDSPAVDRATPLLIAAESGYTNVMKLLLTAGADPNARDQHGDTPLMAAARVGSMDAVKLLLANRADPDARDRSGKMALHWAARTGRLDVVRALTNAHVSIDAIDQAGMTASMYAKHKGHMIVVDFLRNQGARDTTNIIVRVPLKPREAVEKSLPLLEHGWQTWNQQVTCGGCHHRLMIVRVTALAKELGFAVDAVSAKTQVQPWLEMVELNRARLQKTLETEDGVLADMIGISGDGSSGDAVNLNAQLEAGMPRDSLREVRALLLARKQLADGSWRNGLPRVPILSSDFTVTAAAARTIEAYGASADAAEIKDRVGRAKEWLIANQPATTDDKVSRLLGLRWTHADERLIRSAADLLKREQNADGGWSQLRGLNSDAYATGSVLVALHWAIGLPVTDPTYKSGVEYLLKNQEADGSWFVHKRAAAGNVYFETGFPHGKFQFISYAGSCWATMALMYAAGQAALR